MPVQNIFVLLVGQFIKAQLSTGEAYAGQEIMGEVF